MLVLAGIAAAVCASLMFNVGLVLQALEARREPPELGLRLALLGALLRRWRWLAGGALGLAGIAPQVLALALAPFVVVQPALTVGLLAVLAVGVRTFGEPVRRRDWLAVGAIIAGVALVAAGAPRHAEQHRGGPVVVSVVAILVLASLVPFTARRSLGASGTVTMVASGVGFAATNVVTKLFGDDIGLGHYPNAAAWFVVGAVAGIAATLTGMTAFLLARATVVVPVTTAVQTFLPVALEPLFLQEQWAAAPLGGAVLALGFAVASCGTVAIARSPGVGRVAAAAATAR
jgi:drug/metabolite transporter (DMT)-like permease